MKLRNSGLVRSGVGDVALLAGDLVGPGGRVLGLDLDALALERARQRTVERCEEVLR